MPFSFLVVDWVHVVLISSSPFTLLYSLFIHWISHFLFVDTIWELDASRAWFDFFIFPFLVILCSFLSFLLLFLHKGMTFAYLSKWPFHECKFEKSIRRMFFWTFSFLSSQSHPVFLDYMHWIYYLNNEYRKSNKNKKIKWKRSFSKCAFSWEETMSFC